MASVSATKLVVVAALLAATATTGRAQMAPDLLSSTTLRRACLYLKDAQHATHSLLTYCNLTIPDKPADYADWANAIKSLVDPDSVLALAARLEEERWEALRNERETLALTALMDMGINPRSSPGLEFQSRLLWGFSDFVLTRAQQQIDIALVDKLATRVCTEETRTRYLTHTCRVIQTSTVISPVNVHRADELRIAARNDLINLPGNAITRQLVGDSTLSTAETDAALLGRYGAFFLGQLVVGEKPTASLGRLAAINPRPNPALQFSIKATPASAFLYFASLYLAGTDHDAAAVTLNWPADANDLRTLYALKAMLINARHDRPFAPPHPEGAADCLIGSCARIETFIGAIARVDTALKKVGDAYMDLAQATTPAARRAAAFRAISAGGQAVQYASNLVTNQAGAEQTRIVLRGIESIAHGLAAEEYLQATYQFLNYADTLGLTKALPTEAVRGLTFVAAVANAQQSEDVSAAFRTFAAPPNSYLRKRRKETAVFVSLNAYAGAAAGREGACEHLAKCHATGAFTGAFLPFGVEAGVRIGGFVGELFRSVALFVQAIDVGALATWQVDKDEAVSSEPVIGFEQVFAPGAHLIFGIRDLPIVIGVGASAVPNLRKIEADGTVIERNAIRPWAIFIGIDVPILP